MRMYDLIEKKKRGRELSRPEISWMVNGYVSGDVPDYQMAAMLMAIYFRGMNEEETTYLTMEMAASGDQADLSPIAGIKADKHSTGGVGDKTTLIAGPLAAAFGVKVAKMSGRGLGHTGGTVDKLESIPGFRTEIPRDEFFRMVNENGIAVIGQSGNMVPADKKLYALRDVTATVDSIPLIASSIMSKKLAAGSDGIVLDVKTGSGAFMKDLDDSIELARMMTAIGEGAGRRCCALITDMDVPLGYAIGNAMEVKESVEVLRGGGPEDLREVSVWLAGCMMELSGLGSAEQCRRMAREGLRDGRGLQALAAMVRAQGGDPTYILEPERLETAPFRKEIPAPADGYVTHMDAETCGTASVMLGAGRNRKEDRIDFGAGILLKKKTGDRVREGDCLAVLFSSDENLLEPAAERLLAAYEFGENPPAKNPLIYARVTASDCQRFV